MTGATGTVGSRAAHRLAASGYKVRVLARRAGPLAEVPESAEVIQGDLTDPESVERAVTGADLVVHSAAYIGPDWDLARSANIVGTRNMLEAARRNKTGLFVHISTLSVYNPAGGGVLSEQSPLWLDAPYAYHQTKAQAEALVWSAVAAGLRAVVLRPGAILSANAGSYWGPVVVKRLGASQQIRVNPRANLPWVHVENLIDMLMRTVGTPAARGQAYNALDGSVPFGEFIGRIAWWLGRAPEESEESTLFVEQYSNDKIRALGHRPHITFDQAMEELRLGCLELGLIQE